MKSKFLLAILSLVCFQAFASVEEGIEAYQNKNYPLALSKLTEHPTDKNAQFYLGVMYDDGLGVPKDTVQAADWYRKAAEQGEASAQFNLGAMYDNGLGVPRDVVQALAWYRKAADQGVASAQFNLGEMYETGQGVTKDAIQAAYSGHRDRRFRPIVTDCAASCVVPLNYRSVGHDKSVFFSFLMIFEA